MWHASGRMSSAALGYVLGLRPRCTKLLVVSFCGNLLPASVIEGMNRATVYCYSTNSHDDHMGAWVMQ